MTPVLSDPAAAPAPTPVPSPTSVAGAEFADIGPGARGAFRLYRNARRSWDPDRDIPWARAIDTEAAPRDALVAFAKAAHDIEQSSWSDIAAALRDPRTPYHAKVFAAAMLQDEAKHTYVYVRYLEKLGVSYGAVTRTSRPLAAHAWDALMVWGLRSGSTRPVFPLLALLSETVGLAVLPALARTIKEPLLASICARIAGDERRHASGLRALYLELHGDTPWPFRRVVLPLALALLRHRLRHGFYGATDGARTLRALGADPADLDRRARSALAAELRRVLGADVRL